MVQHLELRLIRASAAVRNLSLDLQLDHILRSVLSGTRHEAALVAIPELARSGSRRELLDRAQLLGRQNYRLRALGLCSRRLDFSRRRRPRKVLHVLVNPLSLLDLRCERVDIVLELVGLLRTLPLVIRKGLTGGSQRLTQSCLERRAHARDDLRRLLLRRLDFSLSRSLRRRRWLSRDDLDALQLSQLGLLLLELLSVLVLGLIVLELVGRLLLLPERNVLAALLDRRQLGLGARTGRDALALCNLRHECAKEIHGLLLVKLELLRQLVYDIVNVAHLD